MNEHVKILTSSWIIINRLAGILNQNNIPTLIKDNVESARLAGFGISQNEVDLYINRADLESAQKIMEALQKENLL